jgi:hypothetical protein
MTPPDAPTPAPATEPPNIGRLLLTLAGQADSIAADLDAQAAQAESALLSRRGSLHPVAFEGGRFRVEELRGAIRRVRRKANELRERAATLDLSP